MTAAIQNAHVRDNLSFLRGPHAVAVYSNAAQAISTGVSEILNFQVEDWDTDGFHDNATNNSRLTVPAGLDGLYAVGLKVQWQSNATGLRQLVFLKNGTGGIPLQRFPAGTTGTIQQSATAHERLAAGDYVELEVHQTSGGDLNAEGGTRTQTRFWMTLLQG